MVLHYGVRGPGHLARAGLFYPDALAATDFQLSRYRIGPGGYFVGDPSLITSGWAYSGAVSGTGATVRYARTSGGVLVPFNNNVARIVDQGWLDEAASTNLALHSQDASMWPIVSNVTITGNTGTAPDGTITATTLSRPAVIGDDRGQQNITVANDGGTYFVSLFVRKGASQVAELQLILSGGTGVTATLDFNLLTGATGTSTGLTPFVTSCGQWWRIGFGIANNTTGNTVLAVQFRANIGGTGSADLWGLQVEKASAASSYIPTTTAAVTRAADALTLTYSGAPTSATVTYGAGSTATPAAASPLNMGASSGGAWVGGYVQRVVVK